MVSCQVTVRHIESRIYLNQTGYYFHYDYACGRLGMTGSSSCLCRCRLVCASAALHSRHIFDHTLVLSFLEISPSPLSANIRPSIQTLLHPRFSFSPPAPETAYQPQGIPSACALSIASGQAVSVFNPRARRFVSRPGANSSNCRLEGTAVAGHYGRKG